MPLDMVGLSKLGGPILCLTWYGLHTSVCLCVYIYIYIYLFIYVHTCTIRFYVLFEFNPCENGNPGFDENHVSKVLKPLFRLCGWF